MTEEQKHLCVNSSDSITEDPELTCRLALQRMQPLWANQRKVLFLTYLVVSMLVGLFLVKEVLGKACSLELL